MTRKDSPLEEPFHTFRKLADAVPHVVWITDLNPERVIYVSPSFEEIWGRSAQALYDDPRLWSRSIRREGPYALAVCRPTSPS
jgi:PAS domain-containing protein